MWYEKDNSNKIGLRNNEQVFAAEYVGGRERQNRACRWRAVGNGTEGQVNVLDTTGNSSLMHVA